MPDCRTRFLVQPAELMSNQGLLRGVAFESGPQPGIKSAMAIVPNSLRADDFFFFDAILPSAFAQLLVGVCEFVFRPSTDVPITSWAFQARAMGWNPEAFGDGPMDNIGSMYFVGPAGYLAGQAYVTASSTDPFRVVFDRDHPAVCIRGGLGPLFIHFFNGHPYIAPLSALRQLSDNSLNLAMPKI